MLFKQSLENITACVYREGSGSLTIFYRNGKKELVRDPILFSNLDIVYDFVGLLATSLNLSEFDVFNESADTFRFTLSFPDQDFSGELVEQARDGVSN